MIGGPDSSTYNDLAQAPFTVNYPPPPTVPEPGGVALVYSLVTAGALALRRRRR